MNIGFKVIDFFRKTSTLPIYNNILKSQWLETSKLDELQFIALKNLLIHANEKVPFYHSRFKKYDFNPYTFNDLDDIKALPILTKDDVKNNFNEIKATDFENYLPRVTKTGGSTGSPFITYKDKFSHSYLWGNILRGWNAAGYKLGDRFVQFATGSLLPNASSIKNRIYSYFQNSILIPSYHLNEENIKTIVQKINTSNSKYIYGYSSTISLIAKYCKTNNINIDKEIKAIFTTSDMLYANDRSVIEEIFGAKVYDMYGCPEGGIITFECKEHNGYHVNQESVYISIENQNKNGVGNIISTPLFNYAFPLIKYNTGDIGKVDKTKCNCGRGLERISELVGRSRDFVVLEDGRYIHGAFFNTLFLSIFPDQNKKDFQNVNWIKQYQIIQEDINHITIKFTISSNPIKEDLEKIKNKIYKTLSPNLKIDFDFSGVKYTTGGKFRLILSNVSNNWETNVELK